MKILHLLQDLNIYGGTPKKILKLGKESVHTHQIYTWHKMFSEEKTDDIVRKFQSNGIGVHQNYVGKNLVQHIKVLSRIIETNDIRIIHCYFYFGELLGCMLKVKYPKLVFIISFVGSNNPKGFKRKILNLVYKKLDYYTYNSNYVQREKLNVFPSLSKKKSLLVYNGMTYTPKKTEYKNNDSLRMLSIGGLTEIKNHITIIKAIQIIKKQGNNNINLKIAGDGPMLEYLRKYILKNSLEENVELLGYTDEITYLLDHTDFYLHPCFCEGFGISVLEAMSYGKVILCANSGALPELIEHNVSGKLIAPFAPEEWANQIMNLYSNPALAESCSDNAFYRAKTIFSFENFVKMHDKFLYTQN
jgi:glycosyltransferase involved in cell wall biosynthesis